MRYEIVDERAVFSLEDPKSERCAKRYVSFAGVALGRSARDALLDAVCRYARSGSRSSQDGCIVRFLKPFLACLRQDGLPYPKTQTQWQNLLLYFLRFYLLDQSYSTMSVPNRIQLWKGTVRPALAFLLEERIIPLGVEIPRVEPRREPLAGTPPPLLGQRTVTKVAQSTPRRQKLLVNLDFALNDADYLGRIERECREKIATLRDACLEHWNAMRADHRTGAALAKTISEEEIQARIRDGQYQDMAPGAWRSSALASAALPDGHLWALAVAQRMLRAGPDLNCICVEALRASPFFNRSAFDRPPYYDALERRSALAAHAKALVQNTVLFYRFLGILSAVDVAAACCLLMIEHPQFTSSSLTHAQLCDERGRLFLQASVEAGGALRFSVDKPRAGARKHATLSPIAEEIVTYVIETTAPIRTLMRASGHKAWRYLFLGQQHGGHLGPLKTTPMAALTGGGCNLIRLYPKLAKQGLVRGTLDYRRVRNTMGVLRWFETGSLVEMSRCLGNTRHVALTHYLPPALLHAWNARLIRRFQNTLIILAAHEEDYLLEVTDFTSFGDLLTFMAQLLEQHQDRTSPIASQLHARLGRRSSACGDGRLLNVRCSVQSLAYLYAFDAYAAGLQESQRKQRDAVTGLSVQSFMDLSRMIRHACENPQLSGSLREILDIETLQRCHHEALAKQSDLRARFARFAFNSTWEPAACAA